MSDEGDWLTGETDQARAALQQKAVEEAQIYLLFTEERGRELLRRWDERLMNVRTPVESSIQKYAADEAVRDFVRGIHRQIELAQRRL